MQAIIVNRYLNEIAYGKLNYFKLEKLGDNLYMQVFIKEMFGFYDSDVVKINIGYNLEFKTLNKFSTYIDNSLLTPEELIKQGIKNNSKINIMKIRIIRDLELPNSAYTKGQIMSIEIDYKGRKVFENMFNLLIKAGYAEEIKDFKNNFKIEDDAAFIPCNECKNRIDEFAGSVICEECTFSNMSNSDKIDFNNKIIKLILDKNIENKEIENTASNNIQDKDKLYKQYLEEAEDILGSLKRDGTLNFEGAISIYSKAIELDPYNIEGYLKRGGAKIEIEAYQEAIEDCNKVIELSPKNEKAFKMRGFSKYCLKDYTGALGDYYKVLEYNPNDKSIKDDIDFVTLSIQKEKNQY